MGKDSKQRIKFTIHSSLHTPSLFAVFAELGSPLLGHPGDTVSVQPNTGGLLKANPSSTNYGLIQLTLAPELSAP